MKNEKDDVTELFDQLGTDWDLYEPSEGHKDRFKKRLQSKSESISIRWNNIYTWTIAALFVLCLGCSVFISMINSTLTDEADLASVSPEMKVTQDFFVTAINEQIESLQRTQTPQTKKMVDDVVDKLGELESDYQRLKKDLVQSRMDKRVISAMIQNFQQRIALLKQVEEQIKITTTKTRHSEIL